MQLDWNIQNGLEWIELAGNGWKWLKMSKFSINWWKLMKLGGSGWICPKWHEIDKIGWQWLEMDWNVYKCLKLLEIEGKAGLSYRHSPLNVDDSALWILYMLKQLLSSSLMEVMKPGCPGNVESGETSLSWLYPQSIGSQCKIKDQRYCVWS